mmetsp:Transcript_37258/g.81146  ORF Transcript_37258/g.81146 Transcript_37258/m.81146 type:complete len:361 (+) Transcript_37258:586-1668(+)
MIICDESHALKTLEANRSINVRKIAVKAKRCLLLSGTPMFARPIELFSQLLTLRPDIFKESEYQVRYCEPTLLKFKNKTIREFKGCANEDELRFILVKYFMIRRLKSEVLKDLPSKVRSKFILADLDSGAMNEIQTISNRMQEIDNLSAVGSEEDINNLKNESKSTIMEWWRLTAKAKQPSVCDYLSENVFNQILYDISNRESPFVNKFLIFGHHMLMLDAIETRVKTEIESNTLDIDYIRIDGKVGSETRMELVNRFQNNSKTRIAVLSISAASVGLTLTKAQTVIFAEYIWTPALMIQAEDRAHRIGQTNSVSVVYLHADDTSDDMLHQILERKLRNVGLALDGSSGDLNMQEKKTKI